MSCGDEPDERLQIALPPRSGAVTAVGILAIALGVMDLIGGAVVGGLAAARPLLQQDERIPSALHFFVVGGLALVLGIGRVIGGIGVMKRSNAGRLLTLAMAVFGVLTVLGAVVFNLANDLLDELGVVGHILGGMFAVGFAVFALVVLRNGRNMAEFRG